MLTLV